MMKNLSGRIMIRHLPWVSGIRIAYTMSSAGSPTPVQITVLSRNGAIHAYLDSPLHPIGKSVVVVTPNIFVSGGNYIELGAF